MAKNDFSAEVASNYEQKCLCVLVLDVSGSMSGPPMTELNNGLQSFYKEIEDDSTTSQRLEVSLITFNELPKTVQEPALVENFKMPTLVAGGTTAMVDAVKEAIAKVAARKAWYKETSQLYYRPWIILMTDGAPDDGQDVDGLSNIIKSDMDAKKYVFLPIGVEGADMSVLDRITGSINNNKMGPMMLKGTKFGEFFKWLSASMGTVVESEEGKTVSLPNPGGWMDSFTI